MLAGRVGTVILSAIVAHTGWHWMIERGEVLWRAEWPRLDSAALATLARWVAGGLLAAGAVRLIASVVEKRHRFTRSIRSNPATTSKKDPVRTV